MPLTRRALLISNPGEIGAQNFCKGVYVDIRNYKSHLTSAPGGAWRPEEIIALDRPTAAEVNVHLKLLAHFEFSLIAFSGHGCYSPTMRDRELELKRGEQIYSNELLAGATRRTIILDCCQEVQKEISLREDAQKLAFAESASARIPNPEACRELFWKQIQNSPPGIVRAYSCAIGETSSDDEQRGGRYTGSLFECTEDWIRSQARTIRLSTTPAFSIVEAHDCATTKTKILSANKQNPTVEKPRSAPYFPFAVFA